MKHFPFLLIVCSVFVFGIMASGCSKDLNYTKACEEKDWAKAYEIVELLHQEYVELPDKIEKKWYGTTKYEEMRKEALEKYKKANRYVILHEALNVIEEYGENGLMRIVGIIKEHDAKWLYRELIDVARKAGDKDLEEKFVNMEDVEIKQGKTNFDELTEQEKNEIRKEYEDKWKSMADNIVK